MCDHTWGQFLVNDNMNHIFFDRGGMLATEHGFWMGYCYTYFGSFDFKYFDK